MAKTFNYKRAVFEAGVQKEFICNCQKKLELNNVEASSLLGISTRTLRDWKAEKFTISHTAVLELAKAANLNAPHYKIRDARDYARRAALLGGIAKFGKYGYVCSDEGARKKSWKRWWQKEGKFQISSHPALARKDIKCPVQSDLLAEFIGIVMGDGGITNRQLIVTLHYLDDKEYAEIVTNFIIQLFDVKPSIYLRKKNSTISVVVSRTNLIDFLVSKGLKTGNKTSQQIDIPLWIKNEKSFSYACAKGLFDTDGSVFYHRYKVNGKYYSYPKMTFTSASLLLVKSFYKIMEDAGLSARISKDLKNVWIDKKADVRRYFRIIGTNNPKHLRKIRFNI